MASWQMFLAFFATTALFAFIPGPAMLYVSAQTIARGRWSGIMASLGVQIGGYFHVIASAAGLAVLFHAVPTLYIGVKLLGAAYLIWLGFSMARSKIAGAEMPQLKPQKSARRAFLESISVEVLNPKTAMFFLAFLPQFTDPTLAMPIWLQCAILGTIVNVMFSIADLSCVFLAASVASAFRQSRRAQQWMQRMGGALIVGLGIHLALQKT